MKNIVKMLALMLALVMVLAMTACTKKEEPVEEPVEEPIEEPVVPEEPVEEPMIVGGWTEKDEEITPELQEIFDKATAELLGVGYKAVKLVGTQVVAGTNYKFLAEATTVTNPPTTSEKYVVIYKDLEGNCSVTDVLDVE